jgi:phosphoribosyl-ATP pyrophosphohydrolase
LVEGGVEVARNSEAESTWEGKNRKRDRDIEEEMTDLVFLVFFVLMASKKSPIKVGSCFQTEAFSP